MGTASLWGGFGNGDSAGGDATAAVSDADGALRKLDELAARLALQASAVSDTQANLLPDPPDSTDKQDLRLMVVEIDRQKKETMGKRSALLTARQQVTGSLFDYGGGGLMFGLGTLGIVPAMIAGLVALVAAVVAWVAHVWDSIDARQARLAEIRLADNSRRAEMGLPPLPTSPGEGGVLAGLSDVIGKAGWVVAAIFLGPPLLKALLGGRRKRHAT